MHRVVVLGLALVMALSGITPGRAQPTNEPILADMLRQLPNVRLGGSGQTLIAFTDLALAAAAAGVAPPAPAAGDETSAAYFRAVGQAVSYSKGAVLASPGWPAVFGFELGQIDQILEYTSLPDSVVLFRGRFDPAALDAAWAATGYVPQAEGAYRAIAADNELDLASDRGRLTLQASNYVALLPDGTVAFASTEALITGTIAAAQGDGQSFAAGLDTPALLAAAPANLANAVITSGAVLEALGDPALFLTPTADPGTVATAIAEERETAAAMPPISLVLVGFTLAPAAGPAASPAASASPVANESARAIAVAVTALPRDAATAAEVVTARLAAPGAGDAWADAFTGFTATVIPDEPAVLVTLDLAPETQPTLLFNLLVRRELSFLAWSR